MIKTFLYSLLLSFLPLSAAAGDELACCQESTFGGIIADISTGQNTQPRFYSGKELDRTNNLFWYDFLARPYDPTRGQFTGPDQKAEEYYPWNPFIFCLNNPLKFEDDDGKSALKRGIKFIYGVGKAVAKDGVKALGNAATYTSTFADVKENIETIFSNDASLGERIGAGLSVASELLPASVSDLKNVKNGITRFLHRNNHINNVPKSNKTRFIVDDKGRTVDIEKTPKGTYRHPNGDETDILQEHHHYNKKTHSNDGYTHTHPIKQNVDNKGQIHEVRSNDTHQPTYEEIKNIENGTAVKIH